jgi:hypothetical protein
MTVNEVLQKHIDAGTHPSVIVGRRLREGEEYITIEAPAEGLRFLAELLAAQAEDANCEIHLHPNAAGMAWFDNRSPKGMWIHRLPCENGFLSDELRGQPASSTSD